MLRPYTRRRFLRDALLLGSGAALGALGACTNDADQPATASLPFTPSDEFQPTATLQASPTISPIPSPSPTTRPNPSPLATLAQATPTVEPGPVIGLARGRDVDQAVRAAVENAGGLGQVIRPGQRVLLKVNLTYPSPSGGGIVTSREVLRSAIRLCQEQGAEVIVADGSGSSNGDTMIGFETAGYRDILDEAGVLFFDLNSQGSTRKKLTNGLASDEYLISKLLDEVDVLISLPVLKTCAQDLGVTLSLKNLIGITPCDAEGTYRKQLHQQGIAESIVDLGRLQRIDFAIIDGTVGMEGNGPIFGEPVAMDLVIAGPEALAVDAVGAAVMGFIPESITYLKLLADHSVGTIDLDRITVKGDSIAEVRRSFKPAGDAPA